MNHTARTVYAVHLNYPSRAAQRGRTPSEPSYFLKPAGSLTGSGTVGRPDGAECLGFEGEIAIVVGERAHGVHPAEGWRHVAAVAASNDLGLYDFRYADRGGNVRSKGGDGYTPMGALIDAAGLRPDGLRVRTWLDGELVQDDLSANLLFDFGHLIADLSRHITLATGDVILTGTPAGAATAEPGQVIEVEVSALDRPDTRSFVRTEVVTVPALSSWGAQPRLSDADRADAAGAGREALPPNVFERLSAVSVATLSVNLRQRGYDDVSIDGVRPVVAGRRLVGTARTLRYVAGRADLYARRGTGFTPQKSAIEALAPGEVLVMEARRDPTAGTLGDILALRALVRGAAGVVTDGAVRDWAAVGATGLPVFAAGAHPAVLGRRHVPWEIDATISCGGAAVEVGDVIVGDDDGVIVIPRALVGEVLEAAERQEREEAFIARQVADGAAVDGLYPLGSHWRERYAAQQQAAQQQAAQLQEDQE